MYSSSVNSSGQGVGGYPEVILNVGALNFLNSCKNQSGFDN